MLSSDSKIVEGLRSSTLLSIGFIQDNIKAVGSYLDLRSINKELRQENTRLAYDNFQLQDVLLENIRLHRLLQFEYKTGFEPVPAKIIGFSPQNFVTGCLLSTNNLRKVQKNDAVITVDGLVGKIVKLSGSYAICQNLFDHPTTSLIHDQGITPVLFDPGNHILVPTHLEEKALPC